MHLPYTVRKAIQRTLLPVRSEGPDVSFYQDDDQTPQQIDFAKMATAADYVIIRAGQNTWADPDWVYNWLHSKESGLPRGSYWLYDSRSDPKGQAEKWVTLLGNDRGELPMFGDFEERYGGPYKGWRHWYDFLERVRQLVGDKEIGIYTAFYYWVEYTLGATSSELNYFHRYPLWVANYDVLAPKVPLPWAVNEWLFWQYTSHGPGSQFGVESLNIDLNYFNGDKTALYSRFNINGTPVPPAGGTMKGTMLGYTVNVRNAIGDIVAALRVNDVVYGTVFTDTRERIKFSEIHKADGSLHTLSEMCTAITNNDLIPPLYYMKLEEVTEPVPTPVPSVKGKLFATLLGLSAELDGEYESAEVELAKKFATFLPDPDALG
jgi:GH25 family lysozyme M1 (1,4-beta-N-acetylmuramidase)